MLCKSRVKFQTQVTKQGIVKVTFEPFPLFKNDKAVHYWPNVTAGGSN